MNSLADLKKIPLGASLILTRSLLGPCRKNRTVSKVQSNAIVFLTEEGKQSWLYFPKASEFTPTENGFQIREGGEIAAEYEWGIQ